MAIVVRHSAPTYAPTFDLLYFTFEGAYCYIKALPMASPSLVLHLNVLACF